MNERQSAAQAMGMNERLAAQAMGMNKRSAAGTRVNEQSVHRHWSPEAMLSTAPVGRQQINRFLFQ